MVKRFMLTPCWAGGINSGTVLILTQTDATRNLTVLTMSGNGSNVHKQWQSLLTEAKHVKRQRTLPLFNFFVLVGSSLLLAR